MGNISTASGHIKHGNISHTFPYNTIHGHGISTYVLVDLYTYISGTPSTKCLYIHVHLCLFLIIYLHLVDFTNKGNPLQKLRDQTLPVSPGSLRSQTAGRAGPISKAVAPKPGPQSGGR